MFVCQNVFFLSPLATQKTPEGMQLAKTHCQVFENVQQPETEANGKESLPSDHKQNHHSLTVVTPHFSYLSMHYIGIQFFNHILL